MKEQEYYENINFIESLLRKYDEDLEEHILILSNDLREEELTKERCKIFDSYINNNIFIDYNV